MSATSSTDRTDPECAEENDDSDTTAIAKPAVTTARAPSPPPSYDLNLLVRVTGGIVIGGAVDFYSYWHDRHGEPERFH